MKLAVVSDLHFGDDACVLVEGEGRGWRLRPGVERSLEFLREIDVLVLLGDVFDLSIASYEKAFAASKPFFDLVRSMNVKWIVYVAGNHDAMVWHAIEYETRIARPLADEKERCAKAFRSSLPAIIRTEEGVVELPGVQGELGDIFLSRFTRTPTIVAYPNVYVVPPAPAPTVLLSHGQYLENYWAFGGEVVHELAGDDLRLGRVMTIREVVELNHPLVQLSCTGVGQAGPLTEVARAIQREVKNHQTGPGSRTAKYLERLQDKLDRALTYSGLGAWLKEIASDRVMQYAFNLVRQELHKVDKARGHQSWLTVEPIQTRFRQFFRSCRAEVDWINAQPGARTVPYPGAVVFGHTHVPERWSLPFGLIDDTFVTVANTGGWLDQTTAHVVLFDGTRFSSRPVFEELPQRAPGRVAPVRVANAGNGAARPNSG